MLQIAVQQGDISAVATDGIIVNLFEGVTQPGGATGAVDRALGGLVTRLITDGDIKGSLGEVVVLPGQGQTAAKRIAIVGLGKQRDFTLDRVRIASASAARALRDRGAKHIASIVHGSGIGGLEPAAAARATAEGASLGVYRFKGYQTSSGGPQLESFTLVELEAGAVDAVRAGAERGRILAESAALTRDLQNEPANLLPPRVLAERARQVAEEVGLGIEVYDEQWMREQGMGALLGVAQGSAEPPRFIVLTYKTDDSRPAIGLVGKGITFDTGGISLKPPEGMELMKTDMSGGAAVLGAMRAIALLKPRRNVVGLIPTTENMIGGKAQRPSDVVRAMNGKTIEVVNTDAEGRLILSDALSYAVTLGLTPIVDLATLTGAMSVALGRVRTGVFTNNQEALDTLLRASEQSGERMWPFPLDDEYFDDIKSDVADMKNSGGRLGGSITAAILLKQFVGDTPWLHLDIAGSARSDKVAGYTAKGGTGIGVRTLVHFVESLQ